MKAPRSARRETRRNSSSFRDVAPILRCSQMAGTSAVQAQCSCQMLYTHLRPAGITDNGGAAHGEGKGDPATEHSKRQAPASPEETVGSKCLFCGRSRHTFRVDSGRLQLTAVVEERARNAHFLIN